MPRSQSGSRVVLALRREPGAQILVVDAAKQLAWGGLSLLAAKRAIEKVAETGEQIVRVPQVPNVREFVDRLQRCGLSVRLRRRHSASLIREHLKKLRKDLRLSQEQFALRYGLDEDALQNWEQGRRDAGEWLYGYLEQIRRDPEGASRALDDDGGAPEETQES